MKTGIVLIAEERERQFFEEGWTAKHDDEHTEGELAKAAAVYAFAATSLIAGVSPDVIKEQVIIDGCESMWPFDPEWLKIPSCPIRCLEKSGALSAAEIDRLRRLQGKVD